MKFLDPQNLGRSAPLLAIGVILALSLVMISGRTVVSKTENGTAQSTTSSKPSETTAGVALQKVASVDKGGVNRKEIEGIIRNYLINNPEILLEVQQELERKAEEDRTRQAKVAIENNAATIFRSELAPIIGNPNGDVTVVEFFDYNCGFCRRAMPHLTKLVETDKNVKIVMKEMPIFGQESEDAARAAIAARKQNKYWEMHRALLERPGRANKQKALTVARSLNLDVAKLEADMELPEVHRAVEEVRELALEMGIQGTPHFLVGPLAIPGAPEDLFDQLVAKVAEVRKTGCAVC